MIGIDNSRSVLYEGQNNHGHAVWPQPLISRAKIIETDADWMAPPQPNDNHTLVFREDSFDPLTRIRRGRIYQPHSTQPYHWRVQPHPALGEEIAARNNGGYLDKDLLTYVPFSGFSQPAGVWSGTTIMLGEGEAVTPWTIIGVEKGFSGENSVTLRARSNFGRLPEIDEAVVPSSSKHEIVEAISGLSDRAFRESPVSLIDRCGNVAQILLSRWIHDDSGDDSCLTMDLGAVAKHLEKPRNDLVILICSLKVLARLHARGKPNKQKSKDVRVPGESDAETALALVSTILLEIG